MAAPSTTNNATLYVGTAVAAASFSLLYFVYRYRSGKKLIQNKAKCGLERSSKVKKAGKLFCDLLFHPLEAVALARYLCRSDARIPQVKSEEESFCYHFLTKVSRSFSAVILRLPDELRLPVAVYYLVARALDSIEDDTSIPHDVKVKEMKAFPGRLRQPGWKCTGDFGSGLHLSWRNTNAYEVDLLRNFDKVIAVYSGLKEKYRAAIFEETEVMANGMTVFLTKDVGSIEDFDEYCFYVAGTVGLGLSKLFAASGIENPTFFGTENGERQAIAMGRFLQKTNVIRDYHEDMSQENGARVFYPSCIWSKYATNPEDFLRPENYENAVYCLNELVANALTHIPDCISFMKELRHPRVFQFCSVPQIMAVATLERVFNNPRVFAGVVKIRKGETASLIYQSSSFWGVLTAFEHYLSLMAAQNPHASPSYAALNDAVDKGLDAVRTEKRRYRGEVWQ